MKTWRLYNILDGTYYPKLNDYQLEKIVSQIKSCNLDVWRICKTSDTEWADLEKIMRPSQNLVLSAARPIDPKIEKMEVVGLSTYVGDLQEPTHSKRLPWAGNRNRDIEAVEKRKGTRIPHKVPVFFDVNGKICSAQTVNISPLAIRFCEKIALWGSGTESLIIRTKPGIQLRFKPLIREKELARGHWSVALIKPGQNFDQYVRYLEDLKSYVNMKEAL